MQLPLRSRALLGGVITSCVTLFIGCLTPAAVYEADAGPLPIRTRAPAEAPSTDGNGFPEDRSAVADLPGNASLFLTEGLRSDPVPVIVGDSVAAGWFYPLEMDSTDSGTAGPGAMGLYASPQSLSLAHRSASTADSAARGTTDLSPLLPNSESLRVRGFEPVHLRVGSNQPNGFRLRFSGENRDEEIFVMWTAHLENPLYIVRLPITSVRRTALRDLTGDGVREMVYLSVVFNARGNREIIADALEWDSKRFVHMGSVSLITAINQQLTLLEERLRTETDTEWITTANRALQPIEESLPVGPSLPAVDVQVPRISELSLDLGQGEWEFFHDIAVEGNLYRLRIHLEANPLVQYPARIDGIQGL